MPAQHRLCLECLCGRLDKQEKAEARDAFLRLVLEASSIKNLSDRKRPSKPREMIPSR